MHQSLILTLSHYYSATQLYLGVSARRAVVFSSICVTFSRVFSQLTRFSPFANASNKRQPGDVQRTDPERQADRGTTTTLVYIHSGSKYFHRRRRRSSPFVYVRVWEWMQSIIHPLRQALSLSSRCVHTHLYMCVYIYIYIYIVLSASNQYPPTEV